jgi:hypothetical protein
MGRGLYRGVYSSLPDDPDFQRLTPHARLVFLVARVCSQAGPAAIFRYYPELLMVQTGLRGAVLETSLQELERENWIYREGPILWIRNGLRHDPTMRLSDRKHRKAVERAVECLPRLSIVLRFCDYYGIARPFEAPSRVGSPSPIPSPKKTEEDRVPSNPSPPAEELTSDGLMDMYNECTPDEMPAIETRSQERHRKARLYLAQFPKPEFWRQTFGMMHKSLFLRGLAPPKPGQKPFLADFDWLLSKGKDGTENVVKVHDGKYH